MAAILDCTHYSILTFILPNRLFLFFIHLKMELVTQFPASNNKIYLYLWKIYFSNIEVSD